MRTLKLLNEVEKGVKGGVDWLFKVRNSDFGWGDHAGVYSAASCTSESLIGFARCGLDMSSRRVQESLGLVRERILKRVSGVTKETRNAALPLIAVVEAGEEPTSRLAQSQLELVRGYKLRKGGWPLKPGEKVSNIFDSAWALKSLVYSKVSKAEISQTKKWLYHVQKPDGGWSFYIQEKTSNVMCTAQVTHALVKAGDTIRTPSVKKAIQYLLKNRNSRGGWDVNWEIDIRHPPHNKWFHYTSPFAVLALIESGLDPRSDEITKGIQAILDEEDEEGGWKPLSNYRPFTWATAYALMALGEYSNRIRKPT